MSWWIVARLTLRSISTSTRPVTCRQFPKATNIQMLTTRLGSMRQKPITWPESQTGLAFIGHTRERLCGENELVLPKRRQSSKTVASHVKTILWSGIKVTRILARRSIYSCWLRFRKIAFFGFSISFGTTSLELYNVASSSYAVSCF